MAQEAKKPIKQDNAKASAKTKKKSNNGLIAGICGAVVLVVVIVIVAVVMINKNRIDDSYFVSDGTKYVLTIDQNSQTTSGDSDENAPVKTHLVYTYEGEKITSMKSYDEYVNETAAKAAYDEMQKAIEESKANAESESEPMDIKMELHIIQILVPIRSV